MNTEKRENHWHIRRQAKVCGVGGERREERCERGEEKLEKLDLRFSQR
jgi:hypothetical protein